MFSLESFCLRADCEKLTLLFSAPFFSFFHMGSLLFHCLIHTIGFRQQPSLSAVWPLGLIKETTAASQNTSWSVIVSYDWNHSSQFLRKQLFHVMLSMRGGHSSATRTLIQPGFLSYHGVNRFYYPRCSPGRSENTAMDHSPCRIGMALPVLDAPRIPAEW